MSLGPPYSGYEYEEEEEIAPFELSLPSLPTGSGRFARFEGGALPPARADVLAGALSLPFVADFWSKFELGPLLGEGAFARTFLVKRSDTGKEYALKLLREPDPAILRNEVGVLARLSAAGCRERVACYLAALALPDVIRGRYGFGVLTEYVPGPTLWELLLAGGERGFGCDGLPLVLDLFKAVAVVHDEGYAHRDIKLNNAILRDTDGRVVLIDFGLACATASTDPDACSAGGVGTPEFYAPELLSGELDALPADQLGPAWQRADIYSLGVTAHVLLAARYPVRGEPVLAGAGRCVDRLLSDMLSMKPSMRPTIDQAIARMEGCSREGSCP